MSRNENGIFSAIANLAEKANTNICVNEGDYEVDGLLYCWKCNTQKQTRVNWGGEIRKVMCVCKCEHDRRKAKADEERIRSLRARCLPSQSMYEWTFENDDMRNPQITSEAKKYVDDFENRYKNGLGLLFFGGTGCGKTYASVCIANALIEKGVRCKLTSFPQISMEWEREYGHKDEYLRTLHANDVLIIDDLGVERESSTVYEMMFAVIDSRARLKKPLIITTNLTSDELKNKIDKRIGSRLYQMCDFVECVGADRRKEALINRSREKKQEAEK